MMLREIRAAFRLTRVGVHLVWGAATVAVVYPWIDVRLKRALKRRWSRQLLAMLGVRLKLGAEAANHGGGAAVGGGVASVSGAGTAPPAGLVVCNHISWLDVFVINALMPVAFVAKAEVKGWPLIGWLCKHTETLFLERGSHTAAQRTRQAVSEKLRAGVCVAAFPEGTTTRGDHVLPFHTALFQSAIDANVPVIPLALRYSDRQGNPSRAPAYDGDTTMWQCLRAIADSGGLTADLRVLEPLVATDADRRTLAARCRGSITWHLGKRGFMPRQEEDATTALELQPCFAEES